MKRQFFLIFLFFILMSVVSARLDVGQDKIVKVNEKIITERDLNKFYNLTIKQLEFMYAQSGKTLTDREKPTMKVVLQSLIQSELLKQEIQKTKTIVFDETNFRNAMQNEKEMFTKVMQRSNPDYKFNEVDYRNYIEKQFNITYEEYEQILKDSLLKQQFIYKKTESKIQSVASKKYDSPKDFPVYIPNQRGSYDSYSSLYDYYERNPAEFLLPKSVELKHIFVSTVDFDSKGNPIKLTADKIKIKKEKIDDIYNRLVKGEKNFDELCIAYSEDNDTKDFIEEKTGKKMPGYIGRVFISGVTADYHKALFGEALFYNLFNLQKNRFSQVMEGSLGYHIFYVIEKRDTEIVKFDDVKQDLINLFRKADQDKILAEELTKIMQDLKSKASITYYKDEYKE